MRINVSRRSTRVGNVEIYELSRVTELDAGLPLNPGGHGGRKTEGLNSPIGSTSVAFSHESIGVIESQLAIVIPCMNEEKSTLDGVFHGIPHECLIILVSNSCPSKFIAEGRLLTEFCHNAHRPGVVVHQKDEGLAYAFRAAGLPELVETTFSPHSGVRIRDGKGEAMMIGAAVAKLWGKQFVGFIDADNQVAGSVLEYCKVYAAGLHYALHCAEPAEDTSFSGVGKPTTKSYPMVRIKWHSKPKIKNNKIWFETSGRSSRVVNKWMNQLFNALAGSNAHETIQTSNAGEHAMSIDLAMSLHFATGYAVEPFQLIDAWEQFRSPTSALDQLPDAEETYAKDSTLCGEPNGYHTPPPSEPASPRLSNITTSPIVRILQIETRNPHFHDTSKGEEHIQHMQVQGLSTIYHSCLVPQKLKNELRAFMRDEFSTDFGVNADGEPDQARVYPPLGKMDIEVFRAAVKQHAALSVVGNAEGAFGSVRRS